MNVIRQEVNELSATLTVQLTSEDYAPKVAASIEKYRKTAKIPGFRPGKVPVSLIQKQVGKSVLAEELNKIVNDALFTHIRENNLEILGNPIPKSGVDVVGDFNNPADFEFVYEIGYAPKINIELEKAAAFDYVKVKIDEELVTKQMNDLRRRYGKLSSVDTVESTDMVLGQFVELNEDGSIKEGGILHSSTVSLEFIEDESAKAALVGKAKGDKVVVSAKSLSRGESDNAAMLGIKPEELVNHSDSYQLTINDVKRIELAELNQDLFDRLFGEGEVSSEEELRGRISADLAQMFEGDSDRLLTRSVYKNLVETTAVNLPDDFLKRWIQLSNEKEVTLEQIEQDYDLYAKDLKWQLIQGQLFKANNVSVSQMDAIEYTKGLIVNQYAQYGIPAPEEKELLSIAMKSLANKDEANRIFEMLSETKLIQLVKDKVKLKDKEVTYDEFVALASAAN